MDHMMRAFPLFTLTLLALPAVALDSPVKTTHGLLSGVPGFDRTVTVYKGIPFAAPPLGSLRWRPPQPAQPWAGVRKAGTFSAGCMQKVLGTRPPWTEEFMHQGTVSEDCLYLNLWTSTAGTRERRPVLVYFHGGGFNEGSGSIASYGGENLARKGIVVITVNYRVGVLGFLAHPELTAESGHKASGNYGILDMIAALEWVRGNVAAFGGDPGRITISGQSAGASAVHILTASPLAKGLFHGAIAQSGSSFGRTTRSLTDAEGAGVKFAASKGVQSLAELRAKPAEFEKQARDRYGDGVELFLKLYPSDSGEAQIESARDQGRTSMYLWAKHRAATSKTKAFTYYFNHAMPGPMSAHYRAFHTGEVPYVFDNLLEKPDRPWTAADRSIATTISSYWVNFVRTGDPNGPGLPVWPAFDPTRTVTMEIGDRFAPIDLAPPANLDFFRDALAQPRKP